MRLRVVERGEGIRTKILLSFLWMLPGPRSQFDIIRTFLYRPDYFGKRFLAVTQEVMRGSSEWTVGERELFAAVVSRTNECRFCVGTHTETAAQALGSAWTPDLLVDWKRDTSASPRLSAILGFVEKLTKSPDAVGPEDVAFLRKAGLSDSAIEDAIHVTFVFNTINRIADALDFRVGSSKDFSKAAKMLLARGYRV